VKNLLKDMVTERDGVSFDIGRVSWLLGVLFYFAACGFATVVTKTFSPIEFSTGFAAIMTAGAAAVRIKIDSEQPFKQP